MEYNEHQILDYVVETVIEGPKWPGKTLPKWSGRTLPSYT